MPRWSLVTALVALAVALSSPAHAQRINTLRIEPLAGGGKTLQIQGFHHVGSPLFSPDGQWIAFDGYKGAPEKITSECWIVRSDGTQPRRVTQGATPSWSPDGKQLIFMREERADLGRPGGNDVGVFVINVDGTGERYIGEGRWPAFSPDGTKIAYSVGGRPRGGARAGARIIVANADGSEPSEIAVGDCPTWSPDGRQIACCYNDPAMPAPMIRLVDVAQPDEQKLLGYGWLRANWAADGKSLVSSGVIPGQIPGRGRIGMVRTTIANPRKPEPILPQFDGDAPCPSPDGKLIVFCTVATDPAQVQ